LFGLCGVTEVEESMKYDGTLMFKLIEQTTAIRDDDFRGHILS